jgi:glycosyltransferase involved in cell wall biosynthesis
MSRSIILTVVLPIFNEEEILTYSLEIFRKTLDEMDISYEVLGVDDGSTDKTQNILDIYAEQWPQFRYLQLVSNRGHMAAITAGLDFSLGEYIITIDVDLQDPPSIIPKMLDMAMQEHLHVIYGVREDRRSDTWFKRNSARAYYKILSRLLEIDVPINAADCRLMSRQVVEVLKRIPEKQKVYRLLVPYLGYPSGEFRYTRDERIAGKTKYDTKRMINLAITSLTTFSTAPLRLSTWIGISGLLTFLLGSGFVGYGYMIEKTSPGWASMVLVVLFMGTLQLLSLGILGRYVANMYVEIQNRPVYEVKND